MSCTIIPPVIQDDFLDNRIIQLLQNDLSELDWLEVIYPLAEKGYRKDSENRDFAYAQLYKNDGSKDYLDLFPNDNISAYSFFELETDGMTVTFSEDDLIVRLNIIFFANLRKIDDTKEFDFTKTLIADSLRKIKAGAFSNEIFDVRVTTDKDLIFDRYDYSQEQLKYIMYPNTAFKLSFEINTNSFLNCGDIDINNLPNPCTT